MNARHRGVGLLYSARSPIGVQAFHGRRTRHARAPSYTGGRNGCGYSQEYALTFRPHTRMSSIVLSLALLGGVALAGGCDSADAASGTRITLGVSARPGPLPRQVAPAQGLLAPHGAH